MGGKAMAGARENELEKMLAEPGEWAFDRARRVLVPIGWDPVTHKPTRFASSRTDLWGVFDRAGLRRDGKTLLIQVTDYTESGGRDVTARKKKILEALAEHLGPGHIVQIWAYTQGRGWFWVVYGLFAGTWERLGKVDRKGQILESEAKELEAELRVVLEKLPA
ncbi:MAG: hypothetical protein ACREB9_00300 [Thermoplasmata archaeon]